MTTTLLLFPDNALPADPEAEPGISWLLCSGAGEQWQVQDRGVLPDDLPMDAGAEAPAERVLVVPVEAVLHTAVNMPARQRRQIEAALPFVVEEYLSEDVEAMHLASGRRDGQGRVPVAAMRPERLQRWLDMLQQAGLAPTSARVDADLIASDDELSVLVDADRILLASPHGDRCGGERELLGPLTVAARRELGADPVRVRLARTARVEAAALDLAQLHSELDQIGATQYEDALLGQDLHEALAFAVCQGSGRPIELLQGPFRPQRQHRPMNTGWQLAAGLAASWFVLALIIDLIQTGWLEQRASSLDAQAQSAFVQLLPQRTRSPNPRAELEPLLRSSGGAAGGPGFLELMGAVGQQMQAVAPDSMRISNLNYNDDRGDLSLELTAPGIAVLDTLKGALEAAGYATDIDSAVQEPGGVRARMRIRGGGPA